MAQATEETNNGFRYGLIQVLKDVIWIRSVFITGLCFFCVCSSQTDSCLTVGMKVLGLCPDGVTGTRIPETTPLATCLLGIPGLFLPLRIRDVVFCSVALLLW